MSFLTTLYVLGQIIPCSLSGVLKKKFTKNIPFFFSFLTLVASILFFVVVFLFEKGFDFSGFTADLLKYALPYGACFAITTVLNKFALDCGDVTLTSLFLSFSLIIPTLYGIFFLNNPAGVIFWIGMTLLALSITLVNVKLGKDEKQKRKPITLKWLILVTVGAVANGFSAIFQTKQQTVYAGQFGTEMMVVAFLFALILVGITTILTEKGKIKGSIKSASVLGFPAGILGAMNVFFVSVVIGGNLLPASIYFPIISGGGLVLNFILGRTIFKEKFSSSQYVGLLCGLISVVLLNF